MNNAVSKLNPNKTDSIRELSKVDISDLKKIVASLGEKVWQIETEGRENNFKCFRQTQHIIFRFPDATTRRLRVHDNPIWNIWKSHLLPIMQQAVEPYNYANGQFKAVMLAKLKAGGRIDMHSDGLPQHYFLHKIHIPIQTNDKVNFHIQPHDYYLKEGIAYEVNNIIPHYVVNKGKQDRIHLIFEYIN